MTNLSVKHHYLPKFYLNGFLNPDHQFFIFDKEKERFWKGNPNDNFFEKDRNSVLSPLDGTKKDDLEKMYGDLDDMAAPILKKIIESTPDKQAIDYLEKLQLSFFLATLFWRIPIKDQKTNKLTEELGFESGYLKLVFKYGRPVDQEIKQSILKSPEMKKFFRLFLPFIPIYENEKDFGKLVQNWKIYYSDPGFNITGDNPLIYSVEPDHKNLLTTGFVFPLSSGRLLFNTNSSEPKLNGEFALNMGLLILKQSNRYVCCNNEQFFKLLVDLYKSYESSGNLDEINPTLLFDN